MQPVKTIKPFLLVSFDEKHKQFYKLEGTDIELQLETRFNTNSREKRPEIASIVGTFDQERFPVGGLFYFHFIARGEANEFYLPTTQETFYKVPCDLVMFKVEGNNIVPLPGYLLGKPYVNPDRFNIMAPDYIKERPLKDVAEIIAVHPDITDIKVGDVVKCNKYGCGYEIPWGKETFYKIAYIDVEAIVETPELIK